MTSDNWRKIEAAFQESLTLSGDELSAFLDTFEHENPDLIGQLRNLLAADSQDDTLLRRPIAETVESLSRTSIDPWIGRELGAWTITKRLAGGGMGAVFLAARSDQQYAQTVAIKVMAAQLIASEAIGRFRAERQILANLKHPYIASLIDGGSTDDGLPFLVMEYVEGLPLDRHCDEHELGIDDRLALFRKVCDAVDYAHRNLIVHRDLKPSNILVDGNGDPRLLDFGIAKLLEVGSYENTIALTREGTRTMTPEYASPEQVRGEPISVSTDVYALGVLLFRLVTGQSPYGKTPSTPGEYERAIVEYDPRRPSTVVTAPDTRLDISSKRRTSPQRLSRRLAGDLDNIVLKALQKEPERRYATARDLAADIGRYLRHEPVEARGDDWIYRARKFAVRNARSLTATALVLVSVAALTIYYTTRLADERDRATLAAGQASEVAAFLTGLFESASPHESKGEQITAVDLLQQGRKRIEALQDQPRLQAELMRIMAGSMTALGELDASIEMLKRVLELKEAEVPQDVISISQTTHNLAEALRQNNDLRQAEYYERRTLAIAVQELGPSDSNTAYIMARLGVILFDARRTEEALAVERRALEILIANGDGESSSSLDVRGNIGNTLARLGRYREAESLFRETIELSSRVDGELHPNTIIRRSNLGLVLVRMGKLEEAVSIFEQAIADGLRVWPADYEHIEFMKGSLAASLKQLGRMDEALATYQEAAEMARKRVGEDHVSYLRRARGVASALLDMGRYDEAEAMLDDTLAMTIELEGEDANSTNILRILLGQLDNDRERPEPAERLLRRALANGDQLGSSERLIAQKELADALSAQRRFDEAETLLLQTIAAREAQFGPQHGALLGVLGVATTHYRRTGDLPRSLEYGERIESIIDNSAEALVWSGALALAEYGATLRSAGDVRATAVLARARAVLLAAFGELDPRVLRIDALMGEQARAVSAFPPAASGPG